ncbi:MAG: ORF6N domain-containing protein [Sulfurovum sp.]
MEIQSSQLNYQDIKNKIYTIRNVQVMFDRDLSELYKVETRRLNEQVKRNSKRFPSEFMFQLSKEELENWKSQYATSSKEIMGLRKPPYVFTEQGVSMLSAILRSDIAIEISIHIIKSFIEMKKIISINTNLFQRLENIESNHLKYKLESNEKFNKIFDALESNEIEHKQGIFYDGQIFDAYTFISDLIREAKKSIILIDNYVDDSVLTLFSKNQNIDIMIYTQNISKQLKLDLKKYNSQYDNISIKSFKDSHDRFMIIDNIKVYHIGASLKDLGKKWFAFSKFDINTLNILERLEKIK